MDDNRSAVLGGATIGLLVGLILGLRVGNYWTTVLYAVVVGAAVGVVANILGWHRGRRARRIVDDYLAPERVFLTHSEKILRVQDPADFETTPDTAAACIEVVRSIEDEERWRAAYDSLDSFYAAHEARYPDIRVYAAVSREIQSAEESRAPSGMSETVAQRIVRHRPQAL